MSKTGIEQEIVAEAQHLFDAAGITSDGEDSIIILGMATSPEQDLDNFLRDENGVFIIRGFEIHAQPRLDSLISFLREKGLSAKILGRCGYPLHGEPGTKLESGQVVTNGGRVLTVVAMGKTLAEARKKVYANIPRIHFEGCHYRKDIALIKEG